MNSIKALLFDIDGTVLDTTDFIILATEHALLTHGLSTPPRAAIASEVGKPFNIFYESLTGIKENQFLQDTHRQFQRSNLHLSKLYPNSIETLTELKARGIKLAAVTTRSRITSLDTLRLAGTLDFWDTIVSGEDAPAVKPDPSPLFLALERLGIEPGAAAMIGDSHFDIQAGINAGTKTVRATYGFHQDHLHEPEPDYFINDIKELLSII